MQIIENQMVNYTEPTPIYECMICGGGIYEGEAYYNINGDIVCEEHLKDYMGFYRRVAE